MELTTGRRGRGAAGRRMGRHCIRRGTAYQPGTFGIRSTDDILATAFVCARPIVCAVRLGITVGDQVPGVRIEMVIVLADVRPASLANFYSTLTRKLRRIRTFGRG
jgi:hypothetical protein